MNTHLLRFLTLSILIWLSFTSISQADTRLTFNVQEGSTKSNLTIDLSPHYVRIQSDQQAWMTYDVRNDVLYQINQKGQHSRLDRLKVARLQEITRKQRLEWETQVSKLKPEHRTMAQQQLAESVDSKPQNQPSTLSSIKRWRQVVNVRCQDHEIKRAGYTQQVLCVSTNKDLGVSTEQYQALKQMNDLLEAMQKASSFNATEPPHL